jgi:hypothetical protein
MVHQYARNALAPHPVKVPALRRMSAQTQLDARQAVRFRKERAMNIGEIIREIEVLPDEQEPIQFPEDQPSIPEPVQPQPAGSPVPA